MRTQYCGLVDVKLLDQTVTLYGWAHRRRDHGGVIFIDLRDREGIAQIVVDPDTRESFALAEQVRSEFEELLRRALAQGLHGTAVQIGLGITGGTHFALRQVFDRVISIDINPENIARFKSFHTPDPQRDIIVHGSSRDMGIVNQVVEPEDLREHAMAMAGEIAGNAPLAVRAIKRMMRAAETETFEQNIHHVFLQLLPLMRTADFREGVAAYIEKRTPKFEGR